ncbi:hypothetical protein NC661_07655 [Aquibacillus koreensis]|uniref:Uncharacterized protein n=1 Tax=Aquibacillus koreensis TaxID=279446 RepID=A0A9X3WIB0_9BACI|nr:hypothetical protein [Aquibacillus koreensis]MCT2535790.1 hypothetical protein [Aquibacillus koreensis]MDC3420245.1 hypothetical protein [Aquibacillus koreensis]
MTPNVCRYCHKEIKDRDQLVMGSNFLRLQPFHYVCFQEVEKEGTTVWNYWKPLNGPSGNIRIILMAVLAIVLLVTDLLGEIGDLVAILSLYPVLLRVISIFFFELKIPKQKHH